MMSEEELLTKLQGAYVSGKGLKALCTKHNLDYNSVLRRAKLENWTVPTKKPTIVKQKKAADKKDLLVRGHDYSSRMADLIENTLEHLETLAPQDVLQSVDEVEKLDRIARRSFGLDDEVKGGPTLNVNILAQGIAAFAQVTSPELLPSQPKTIELQNAIEA